MNRSLFEGLPEVESKADGQLYRMTPEQFKRACALIRGSCCNYTDGACLLLGSTCPQLISTAVCCKVFRWAILENPAHALLKAEIFGCETVKTRTCEVCGAKFKAVGNRSKYCARCGKKVRKQQATARKQKQRGLNVTL